MKLIIFKGPIMNKIKIISDSSCDLSNDIIEKYNINVVPLNVSFGGLDYLLCLDVGMDMGGVRS